MKGALLSLVLLLAAGAVVAQPTQDDPVHAFVKAMADGRRSDALALVDGPISQLNGTGPNLLAGPHKGLWRQRIVSEKDSISISELQDVLANCQMGGVRLISGTPEAPDKVVKVFFNCDAPRAVHFIVRRFEGQMKVVVSDVGQDLWAMQDGKTVLTNEQ